MKIQQWVGTIVLHDILITDQWVHFSLRLNNSFKYLCLIGLNSGVMLMNLTRMREVNMISKIINIFDEYHLNITWGDQCLLNIYFHFYPGKRILLVICFLNNFF